MIARRTLIFATMAIFSISGIAGADDELAKRASWKPLTALEVKAELDKHLVGIELDELTKLKVEALWPQEGGLADGGVLLEQLAVTLVLTDGRLRNVVELCRAEEAPNSLPAFAVLNDEKTPAFVRNNLRLLYGRWLAQRDYYDEALEQIDGLKADEVVDPASLLFYQSVGHHRLLDKKKCLPALSKLLENEQAIPRRYSQLAHLMEADLKPLKADSLDEIARIMRNVENRLDKGRAGARVRKEEDDIVAKLDKLIEELEKQQGGGGSGSGNGPPKGGPPSSPMNDSNIANDKGPGNVDPKKLGNGADWGDLPPKQRQAALQQIAKDLPAHYREVIEEYFRKLARDNPR